MSKKKKIVYTVIIVIMLTACVIAACFNPDFCTLTTMAGFGCGTLLDKWWSK